MTRWVSTVTGDLDQGKLKTLAAVFLALIGGVALIAGTLYQTFVHSEANTSGLIWMAGICVAPLTGGVIGLGVGHAVGKVQSQAIAEGTAPGRRLSDQAAKPPEEGA